MYVGDKYGPGERGISVRPLLLAPVRHNRRQGLAHATSLVSTAPRTLSLFWSWDIQAKDSSEHKCGQLVMPAARLHACPTPHSSPVDAMSDFLGTDKKDDDDRGGMGDVDLLAAAKLPVGAALLGTFVRCLDRRTQATGAAVGQSRRRGCGFQVGHACRWLVEYAPHSTCVCVCVCVCVCAPCPCSGWGQRSVGAA